MHALTTATQTNPTSTILSIDGIGAYDTISRTSMLEGLRRIPEANQCLPFVRLWYAQPSQYVWHDTQGQAHTITQAEGGEQGDPLMPALFSIGQHAALAAVQAQLLPGEALHAYLDDVYAVVQPNRVRPVYELLARHLHTHARIQLNSGKTRLGNQAGQQPPNTEDLGSSTWVGNQDLPREQQGLTILGVPVGSTEFVQAQLQHIQENHATLLQQLPHLNDLQASWLLLLCTASPRSNYLLRLLPPNTTATFAQTHDAAVTACLAQLLEQQDMPAPALARAHLPLAAGGLGLAPATFLAAAAHWASWADALPVLQRQAPHIAAEALRHFSHPTTAPPAL